MRGAKPSDIEALGPAAVIAILILGTTLTFVAWTNLRRSWQLDVERETQAWASTLSSVVAAEMLRLDTMLRRRAQMWTSRVFDDGALWRDDVAMLLAEAPALLAVLRADPTWQIAGSEDGRSIVRSLFPESRSLVADADAEWIVGPLRAEDGRDVFGFQVRAVREGDDARSVFAVVDADRLLRDILDTRALGHGVTVRVADTEVYRRSADESTRPELAKAAPITVPGGPPWSIEVVPGGSGGAWEDGPAIALFAGLLGSSLMAAAIHYGTLAWRRERVLRATNEALRDEVDVTRRGEAEMKRLSSELEARVAERTAELHETIVELETFNYSVSHDLRGPLGAIINFAAILQEDYRDRIDTTGREHLGRIVTSAGTAVSMMDALLAYSRSGRTELRKAHLDMRKLVEGVYRDLVATHPAYDCCVEIGELPSAYADEAMMRFVFANLLGNACKFTREGETPRVEVSGAVQGDEATYVVRDEGIGFDMRFAEKLFKPFERLHPAGQRAGHGIGLAIVARLVRRHGGRVWAQGAIDKGATFYVSLPVAGA
jgi:signal transduction histidine kinase